MSGVASACVAAVFQLTAGCLLAQGPFDTRWLPTMPEGVAESRNGGRPSFPGAYGACQPTRIVRAIAGAGAGALAGWLTYSLLTLGGGSHDADGRRARRNVVIVFAVVGSVGAAVIPADHSDCVSQGASGSPRTRSPESFDHVARRLPTACEVPAGTSPGWCLQSRSALLHSQQAIRLGESLPTVGCNVAPFRSLLAPHLGTDPGILRPFGAGDPPRAAQAPVSASGIQSSGHFVGTTELTTTLSWRRFLSSSGPFRCRG